MAKSQIFLYQSRFAISLAVSVILTACSSNSQETPTPKNAIPKSSTSEKTVTPTNSLATQNTTPSQQPIAKQNTQEASAVTPLSQAVIERSASVTPMKKIASGAYRPLYLSKNSPIVKVSPFQLDTLPVTNAQFYRFVSQNPDWQKQNIAKLFTESDYLKHWQATSEKTYQPAIADLQKPVVNVSWYAANAYCQTQGKKLPTVAQWEYVAQASATQKNGSKETGYNQKILDWYADSANKPLTDVGQDPANVWGIHNMHGLIWEWTDDFNSNLVSGESRADSNLNQGLFCGSGAAGAVDPSDYAAFMRYGFRSSLQSKFALASLGFRCATTE